MSSAGKVNGRERSLSSSSSSSDESEIVSFHTKVKAMVEGENNPFPVDTERVEEEHQEGVVDNEASNNIAEGVPEDSTVVVEEDEQDELNDSSSRQTEELIQIEEQDEYDQEEEGEEEEDLQFHEGHFDVAPEDERSVSVERSAGEVSGNEEDVAASPTQSSTSSEEDEDTNRSERPKRTRTAPKFLQYDSFGNPSYGQRGETAHTDR